MAGQHRSGQRAHKSRKHGNHLHRQRRGEPYKWLGVGAITLGLGAALASGTGLAHATDTGSSDSNTSGAEPGGATSSSRSTDSGDSAGSSTGSTTSGSSPGSESTASFAETNPSGATTSDDSTTGDDEETTPSDPSSDQQASDTTSAQTSDTTPTDAESDEGDDPAPTESVTPPSAAVDPTTTDTAGPRPTVTTSDSSAQQTTALRISAVITEPSGSEDDSATSTAGQDSGAVKVAVRKAAVDAADTSTEITPQLIVDNTSDASPAATAFISVPSADALVDVGSQTPAVSTNPLRDLLTAIFLGFQRTFFNQNPTANPKQDPDVVGGVVTGDVGEVDPDGDPLTVTLTQGPANGTVVVNADGTYSYTPSKALALTGGTDEFTVAIAETNASTHIHGFEGLLSTVVRILTFGAVRLNDGSTTSQTIRVSIGKVNFAPEAGSPHIDAVDADTGAVTGTLGFTDVNNDPLTYSVTTEPMRGSVTVSAAGGFTYVPDADKRPPIGNPTVTDTFVVTATDPAGASTLAAVTVTVAPIEFVDPNNPPQPGNPGYAYTVDPNTGIVRGDLFVSDVDSDELIYRLVGDLTSADGTAAVNVSTGQWAFRPSPQARLSAWDGERSTQLLSIVVSDGNADITIKIDAPVAPGFDVQASVVSNVTAQLGGVAVAEDGNVYLASIGDGTIRVLRPDGSAAPPIQVGGTISGVALDNLGRLVVSDPSTGAVSVIDPTGASSPQVIATVDGAAGVTVDSDGRSYVSSISNPTLTVLDSVGNVIRTVDLGRGSYGVAAGSDGHVYAVAGDSVVVIDSDGDIVDTIQTGLGVLYAIAMDERGIMYVTDIASKLHIIGVDGTVLHSADLVGTSAGVAITPDGLLVSSIDGSLTEVTFVAPAETASSVSVNPITAVVTGGTDVLNPGGFHFALASGPDVDMGVVAVDAATGEWRFTPTSGARHLALSDPSAANVTFTIVVTGGFETVTATITAPVMAGFLDDDGVLDPDDLLALSQEGLVTVAQNSDGTVRSLDGTFTTNPVSNVEDAAEAFNRIAGLLGYSPGFVSADDFTRYSPETADGEQTQVYYYLDPTMGGIPIVGKGSSAVLVTDANGVVQGMFSGLDPALNDVDLDPAPGFEDADAAETIAKTAVAEELAEYMSAEELASYLANGKFRSELVVYYASPLDSGLLTWRVTALSTGSEEITSESVDEEGIPAPSFAVSTLYIQANGVGAGQIVARQSLIDGLIASQAVDARDLHNAIRSIIVSNYTSDGGGQWFHDPVRGISVYSGPSNIAPEFLPGTKLGYDAANPDKRAVSAMYSVTLAYDNFRDELGFKPRGHVFVTVVPTLDVAAYYVSGGVYRDDGGTFTVLNDGMMGLAFDESWASARDVVAHEYTHGFLDFRPGYGRGDSTGLGNSAQAQALEEAFADILGTLVEATTEVGTEFLVGDNRFNCDATCSMRSLSMPKLIDDPNGQEHHDRFSEFVEPTKDELKDYNEYLDSTIFSFAAAKMIENEDTAAISDSQWTKVFGRAILTLQLEPTFSDARDAVVFSARTLGFTPTQLAAVNKAFDEVGIVAGNSAYVPPSGWQGVTLDGMAYPEAGSGSFNRDGRVAVMSVYDTQNDITRVALIDTALGTQFGRTFEMAGMASAAFLTQGDRLLIQSLATSDELTRIAVLDTLTGRQIGNTVILAGSSSHSGLTNSDSILVVDMTADDATSRVQFFDTYQGQLIGSGVTLAGRVVSRDYEVGLHRAAFQTVRDVNGTEVGEFHLVDTFWGDKVGTAVTIPAWAEFFKSPDFTRLIAAGDDWPDRSLHIVTIDTDTGEQVGEVITVEGVHVGDNAAQITMTSNRAVFTYGGQQPGGGPATHVSILDLTTGTLVGSGFSGSGIPRYTTIDPTGTRAVTLRHGQDADGVDMHWISVVDLNTGQQIGTQVTVPGSHDLGVESIGSNLVFAVNSDSESRLVVVNATTGTQVGSVTTLAMGLTNIAAAGNRVIATALSPTGSKHVVVVDGLSGHHVGISTLTPSGNNIAAQIVVNADGSRAAITQIGPTRDTNYVLEVLNTQTGAIIGTPVVMSGPSALHSAQFTSDGSRIVMSASGYFESPFAVIDAATGRQLSSLIFPTGFGSLAPAQLSADGRRALVVTYGYSAEGGPKRSVSVIDITTGKLIGKTVHLPDAFGWELLDAQGRRAALTTRGEDRVDRSFWTQTIILDLETGKQISPFVRP